MQPCELGLPGLLPPGLYRFANVAASHAHLATLQQRLRILEEARSRDQHATLRQLRAIGDMRKGIVDDLSALNEWHRRAP